MFAFKDYKRAIVMWNGGNGALLCNHCRVIVREGTEHEDIEHYCVECLEKNDAADYR